MDYGSSSFRIFHYKFMMHGFVTVVGDSWFQSVEGWGLIICGLFLRRNYNFLRLIYGSRFLLCKVGCLIRNGTSKFYFSLLIIGLWLRGMIQNCGSRGLTSERYD